MKLFRLSVALAAVLFATAAYSQNASYRPPVARTYSAAAGASLAPQADSPAAAIVQFLSARGITVPEAALVDVTTVNALNNVSSVRFEERAGGLAVYGVYAKAAFNARGELIHLIENLVPTRGGIVAARVSAAQALAAALREHYGDAVALPPQARTQGNAVIFARTPFFHREPTVTRVAIADATGAMQPALLVETWSEQGNLLHHTLVSGDGAILAVEVRTNSESYNVFVVDPVKSLQTVVSGNGWLGGGDQTTFRISGPNVRAYLDTNANNIADSGGTLVSNGEFLTALDTSVSPGADSNKAVAVQNLFYLNNVMHDVLKTYGFNVAAGNFEGSDPVNAEAQDGSGTDNANFSTPADGSSPRMQMYLWSNGTPNLEVVVGSSAFYGKGAEFGPTLNVTGVPGALAVASIADGCAKPASLAGRIAIIDRGNCTFKKKVANAQAVGAVGVVIVNNEGDGVMVMGDDSKVRTAITIPSIFIGQSNGATLKTLAGQSAVLRNRGLNLQMTDASLDSDVVFHEYGHGLTWRMIGGMSGPMAGAVGEGASDGVALLMNAGDRIGEYSSGDANGIRRHPYAGYPNTYADVTGSEVHDDGEVFAAIVYDLKDAFTLANLPTSTLFAYYVDGMNYIPATPAFEHMRDGMLQSAVNDSVSSCLIWRSFAKFGVGVGARATVRGSRVSVTESFNVPASCQ
jgi:extracellular elastinolytic metalloproteinase